jgi:electron transport complex protein RnfE
MTNNADKPEVTQEQAKELLLLFKPKGESNWKIFSKGIILENPVLILMIGLCPTLATSTTAFDAAGMSAAVLFVLVLSNVFVSLFRKIIPNEVRIPVFIVIISTFVTIIDYVMQAYQPDLYKVLGIFVPLIVVNCIILGRAEAFAYQNGVWKSFLDGMGKSFGFAVAIIIMGSIREILSKGTWFGIAASPGWFRSNAILFFGLPPGAFLVIGLLKAGINKIFNRVG